MRADAMSMQREPVGNLEISRFVELDLALYNVDFLLGGFVCSY